VTVEIETFDQTRFRCPSCRKSWAQRSRVVEHVRNGCVSDPATRACKTCAHWDRGEMGNWRACAIGKLPHGQDWIEPWTKNCEWWVPVEGEGK
jgi:hypothetical protein